MSHINLSPKHGLNPSLDCCFFCMEPKGVALFGSMGVKLQRALGSDEKALQVDPEAPHKVVLDQSPCRKCERLMGMGVILISADPARSEPKSPYRTGGWVVLKEDAVKRIFEGESLERALKMRAAFVEDEVWDKLGLPRGAVEGVPSELPEEG